MVNLTAQVIDQQEIAPSAAGTRPLGSTSVNDGIDWTFEGTWPYEPCWFKHPDGWMHYIDEGPKDAPAVVLVHGNPTWGYLYRNFIPPLLEAGYRVVVPDHLGFGRSDKPSNPDLYRIPKHAQRFEELIKFLDLREVTLVPQDWGGPIGLAWAGHHPDRVARLFILNTFAHKTVGTYHPPLALTLFRTPIIGELLVKGLHTFVRGLLFGKGIHHQERMTATVRRAYLAPHPTWASRTGVLVFPREIPATPDAPLIPFLEEIEANLQQLQEKPVFLGWAMKDPVFTPDFIDTYWKRSFPEAEVLRLSDASHYLQEDAYEQLVPELLDFMKSTQQNFD